MKKSNGPKTPNPLTEDDPKQSEAFRKAVSDLEAAGELNDIEADDAIFKVLQTQGAATKNGAS